jgi:hypothetical protein
MKNKFLLLAIILFFVTIESNAQVGIGNAPIDNSAILDLNVSALPVNAKKGFLGPRVALSGSTDQVTIPSPAIGLLIYNLGTNGTFTTKGFLYWTGTEWLRLDASTTLPATISTLVCATAVLTPSQYTIGVPYSGTLEVPYTGGNGASYDSGPASSPVNGLVLTLQQGKLAYGSGKVIYNVSGTTTVSSPATTTFSLSFLGKSCSATVGKGNATVETSASIGAMALTTNPALGAEATAVTPDGQFEVRFYILNGQSLDLTDLQIRYIGPNANSTIMWQGGVFYGDGAFGRGGNSMTMTKDIWWGSSSASNGSAANTAWGDPDVYYNYPEYRHYAWTTTINSEKVVYLARFFMGAAAFPYVNYPNAKAVILIEQVKAN